MREARFGGPRAAAVAGAVWAVLAACGGSHGGASAFAPGGADDDAGATGAVGDASPAPSPSGPSLGGSDDASTGPFADFPAAPVVVAADADAGAPAAPANAAALFASGAGAGADAGGASPCLLEPEVGSLVPRNWLRPRFRWVAANGEDLFEVRLHADNQVNDLVVYTAASEWTMPEQMWNAFRGHSAGAAITVAVRGGVLDPTGAALTAVTQGSSGPWGIAPADAPGSIVYWHIIGNGEADLKGFSVGDDSVRTALDPGAIEEQPAKCVGCHTSSPDGKYAIFSSDAYGGYYGVGIASVEAGMAGKKPPFMTSFGEASLASYLQGITTAAASQWTDGHHLVVGSMGGQLRWVNLDATDDASSKGVLALTGDPRAAPNSPNLSHDGTTLVYVSGSAAIGGRPSGGDNDVYTVPFNGGAGGAATPLAGAATPDNEYYPSFSPDDRLVAFDRVPAASDTYSAPAAEVYVVPSAGGAAQRLAANDPPACSGATSPGVENSWPRWAPASATVAGKTYYWLVFSSTRLGGGARQLFMAPVVVDATGAVQAYKAVYLWNQPADEKNHTPAWDNFAIPPAPPEPPR